MLEKFLEAIHNNIHKKDNLLKDNQASKLMEIMDHTKSSTDDY